MRGGPNDARHDDHENAVPRHLRAPVICSPSHHQEDVAARSRDHGRDANANAGAINQTVAPIASRPMGDGGRPATAPTSTVPVRVF